MGLQVYDKSTWFVSYKDVPKFRGGAILPGMFPSGRLDNSNRNVDMGDIANGANGNAEDCIQAVENPVMPESVEEVSDLPLEHCMRIVPHDQNTGAFFIAVLQKVSPLPGSFSYYFVPLYLILLKDNHEILVNFGKIFKLYMFINSL